MFGPMTTNMIRGIASKLALTTVFCFCIDGCGVIRSETKGGHFSLKMEGMPVVTNDKHTKEPVAIIVRPHSATLSLTQKF